MKDNNPLIEDLAKSIEQYEKSKDLGELKNAYDIYLSLYPYDDFITIQKAFENAPPEFIELIADKEFEDFKFLTEAKSSNFELYIDHFLLLNASALDLNNRETFYSRLIKLAEQNNIDTLAINFLKYFHNETTNDNLLQEILHTPNSWLTNSWLATSLLAGRYLDEGNNENALFAIRKSSEILKLQLKTSKKQSHKNEKLDKSEQLHISYLNWSLSKNIETEIRCYFESYEVEGCIDFCNSILNCEDEELIDLCKQTCYYYKAYSYSDLKKYKEALIESDNLLSINNADEDIIRLKMFLLERLKKFDAKIDFINELGEQKNKLYYKFFKQIERLKSKSPIVFEEKETVIPRIEKRVGRRLLNAISYSGNEFASEKLMEAFIVSFIERKTLIFGRQFSIYKDNEAFGRQFRILNGVIDLLLVDDNTNDLFVLEIKKDKGYNNNPLEQLKYYQEYIKNKVALNGQKVWGILCLKECDENLKCQVEAEDTIELYSYDFSFTQEA